jgi:parvulin-like peptidyl-prolyl isomerase
MVPEFEAAAFGLKVGDLSPVVKTSFGYHVIRVTGRQDAGVRSQADATEEIRGRLSSQAKDEAFGTYLESLRKGADVKYGGSSSASALPAKGEPSNADAPGSAQ